MKKRIDGVEISELKKRGGQPGNSNALKTGRHTRDVKNRLREIRVVLRSMNSMIARAKADHALTRLHRARAAP